MGDGRQVLVAQTVGPVEFIADAREGVGPEVAHAGHLAARERGGGQVLGGDVGGHLSRGARGSLGATPLRGKTGHVVDIMFLIGRPSVAPT